MSDTAVSAGPLSLRAFAKSLGVSDTAVRKAIKAGRLGDAVGQDKDGAPCVVDVAKAAERWRSTTRTGVGSQGSQGVRRAAPGNSVHLVDAQRDATSERARKLRLENDAREGQLVQVAKVKREAFQASRTIREAMLNLPARLAGELAAETEAAVVFRTLDVAIREALSSTADVLAATVH
jgi:hypothetical protein